MDSYAVVGNPIAHSKSPEIHRQFAEQTGQAITYNKMLVEKSAFDEEVCTFFALGGMGLNVTVPFKENAYHYADQLTDRAKAAGAVNTLALQTDGSVLGDNTDGAGLIADFLARQWSLKDKSVLLLGAGGAVRGVIQPLLEQQPAKIVIANRTVSKAEELVDLHSDCAPMVAISYAELENKYFDVVINGTSASLSGDLPPLPEGLVDESSWVYDMMYGPEPTAFMKWASERGVVGITDGLGMLVGQAAESFNVWRGVMPKALPVVERLRSEMSTS